MAEKAPLAVIVCGNMDRVEKEDLWWPQDLAAAVENILIQTVEEGLGATWLGFYPVEERVDKMSRFLKLPNNIIPFAVVIMGYPEEENYFTDKFEGNKIHFETYNA